MNNQDVLYSQAFQTNIHDFMRLVRRETNIVELMPVMSALRTSDLLNFLMNDPLSESAKTCLQQIVDGNYNIPREFFAKFMAIVNMKVRLSPTNLGLMYQSYNAKVLVTNIEPTKDLTNLTLEARQDELREDATKAILYNKKTHIPARTVRLQINDDLLPKCINAMADLNRVIVEGNRANGYTTKGFVDTHILSNNY